MTSERTIKPVGDARLATGVDLERARFMMGVFPTVEMVTVAVNGGLVVATSYHRGALGGSPQGTYARKRKVFIIREWLRVWKGSIFDLSKKGGFWRTKREVNKQRTNQRIERRVAERRRVEWRG